MIIYMLICENVDRVIDSNIDWFMSRKKAINNHIDEVWKEDINVIK